MEQARRAFPDDVEPAEVVVLLEAISRVYGFDFRGYAAASIRRRIRSRLEPEGAATVSQLQDKVLHDPACWERLLLALTVHETAMFRDPGFYVALREKVVPFLRTWPFVRIWHAGCATGEEVHSLAILLLEEGLLERSRIYATDLSEAVLDRARAGVYPLAAMKDWTDNYMRAGGKATFSDYYTADHERAVFRAALRERVVFAQHNLVTDGSFNEFHVVFCRNVMIYLDRPLQDRVHKLIHESLAGLGYLALGNRETVRFSSHESRYEVVDDAQRIWRKVP